MQYLDVISKTTEWSVSFQGKPFNITVIHVYASTSNAEKTEVEPFYEDLQDLIELTSKRCPLHYRGLEWVNLIQMTIISTTVGKNPLEEME